MNWFAFLIGFALGNVISPGLGIPMGVVYGMVFFPPRKRV